jgi:glutaredoxin 3
MKKVFIYTTDYCPYCVKAKGLLKQLGIDFEEVDASDSQQIREDLVVATSGRKTVPQIFIGGDMKSYSHYVGGCDDLYALNSAGKLMGLLG